MEACAAAGIDPLIAMARQSHHQTLDERFAPAPPTPHDPTAVEAMAHRMKTPDGKKLCGLRKQTPEPVFGIIKSVLGFRQFLLRGIDRVRGEWTLVTMAWNMKRMFVLARAMSPSNATNPASKRFAGPNTTSNGPTHPRQTKNNSAAVATAIQTRQTPISAGCRVANATPTGC